MSTVPRMSLPRPLPIRSRRSSTARRALHTGSTPTTRRVLIEESPLRGNDDFTYAKNKKELEGWMKGFEKAHPDILLTVIRPVLRGGSGVHQPSGPAPVQEDLHPSASDSAAFQYIHEDDLVEIMYLLLKNGKTGVYNLSADGTMTFDEMLRILGGWPLKMPVWLLWPMNDLMWNLRVTFMTEFPSPCLNLIRYPWIASNAKVKERARV